MTSPAASINEDFFCVAPEGRPTTARAQYDESTIAMNDEESREMDI